MAMTVITMSNVPISLRGDLTKWMQEIATGVYIGDLNSRIREELWQRVTQSAGKGQATLSYSARNELGYQFRTYRTRQENVSFDGIPLVMIPKLETPAVTELKPGFSNQAKFRQASKYAAKANKKSSMLPYVVVDIETTGLDPRQDAIIEIAAVKIEAGEHEEFHCLVSTDCNLPDEIIRLTGITDQMLAKEGQDILAVLDGLVDFIGDLPMAGYNLLFDIDFLNKNLKDNERDVLKNRKIDLLPLVKREKMFLESYKLKDVLLAYGITATGSHRALADARATHLLSTKVNGFHRQLNSKH